MIRFQNIEIIDAENFSASIYGFSLIPETQSYIFDWKFVTQESILFVFVYENDATRFLLYFCELKYECTYIVLNSKPVKFLVFDEETRFLYFLTSKHCSIFDLNS